MNVVKLSTCLSVMRAMIGVDRLNICLKQFTGGSQSHPRPLTTQQDTTFHPSRSWGAHVRNLCRAASPLVASQTANFYLSNSRKQSKTWGESYVISGCNFFSTKSQKWAFLWKFNSAFLNGPTASTTEGDGCTGRVVWVLFFFLFTMINKRLQV